MNSTPVTTLIIDDEPAARRGVRLLLERDPEIRIAGEAASGSEAVEKIRALKPDLVLLDVQIPEMNGFQVLETVTPHHAPAVIFLTAYDEYALHAFEINAVDYLLKPYEDERFWTAVTRAKRAIQQKQASVLTHKLTQLLAYFEKGAAFPAPADPARDETITRERILLKSGGEIYFLKADEIDWIQAEGDYMKFYADGRTHLLRETMGRLEERLDPNVFIRIHRSTIVNIRCVKKLSPGFAGEYAVILQDGTKLRLSRSYHGRVQEMVKAAL